MLTGIPFVDAHGALRPGQLLEVCGVGGSGKTEILMQAAVHAVMPRKRGGVAFGGCEASVLLIDLDGKFDTLRLIKILTAKIRETVDDASARAHGASASSTNADHHRRQHGASHHHHPFPGFHPSSSQRERRLDDARGWDHPYGHDEGPPPWSDADRSALRDRVYAECMGRFQTLRCHCSLDFLKSLAVAERVFAERERAARENELTPTPTPPEDTTLPGGRGVASGAAASGAGSIAGGRRRLLLIDNVAAFYWLDRASRAEHGAPLSLRAVHHASAARLMELSRRCRAPIIVTKATTSSESSSAGAGDRAHQSGFAQRDSSRGFAGGRARPPAERAREHRDFLPQQWTSAVTQRLVLDVERTVPGSVSGMGGDAVGGGGGGGGRRPVPSSRFEGAGGYGVAFAARWELPRGRPGARYVVGDRGIQCRG